MHVRVLVVVLQSQELALTRAPPPPHVVVVGGGGGSCGLAGGRAALATCASTLLPAPSNLGLHRLCTQVQSWEMCSCSGQHLERDWSREEGTFELEPTTELKTK